MKIYIASDHAGFSLKKELISYLENEGNTVKDFGAFSYEEVDDYPDFVTPCVTAIAQEAVHAQEYLGEEGIIQPENIGIIIGGSGQGEAMAANKIKGVRAALYYGGSHEILTLSREHNNANVLSLGARFLSLDEAKEAVAIFLRTPFSQEERHIRRLAKF